MLPAIIGVGSKLPQLARLVGAGMRGGGGFTARRAIANDMVAANHVARANLRRDLVGERLTQIASKNNGAVSPAQVKASQRGANINMMVDEQLPRMTYQQAMPNVSGVDMGAYRLGQGLGTVNRVTAPVGGLTNVAITGAFLAPALLPQGSPEPEGTNVYGPMQNQFGYYPTPQGGQGQVDQRWIETAQQQGLTQEQIVKARRRMEEQAQLSQLYAGALSMYEQP